jgi:hypothetical protein
MTLAVIMTLLGARLHAMSVQEFKIYLEKKNPGVYSRYFIAQEDYENGVFRADVRSGICRESDAVILKPLHNSILKIWMEYIFAGKKAFTSLEEVAALLNDKRIHIKKRAQLFSVMYFETKEKNYIVESIRQYPNQIEVYKVIKDKDFNGIISSLLARAFEEREGGLNVDVGLEYNSVIRCRYLDLIAACDFQGVPNETVDELFRAYPFLRVGPPPGAPDDKEILDFARKKGPDVFMRFQTGLMASPAGRRFLSRAIKEELVDRSLVLNNIKTINDSEEAEISGK